MVSGGSAGNNIFAVGDNGEILHYDGNNWTPRQRDRGIILKECGAFRKSVCMQ